MYLCIFFLNRRLGAHVGFYELAGKHEPEETHAEHEFWLTTTTYHVGELKLTS